MGWGISAMSLYSDFSTFKSELLNIREELGDPRVRVIAFEYPSATNPTFLVPKLVITTPPKRLIGISITSNQSTILVTNEDLWVSSVSRNYPKEMFNKAAWVDAEIGQDGKLSGVRCTCIYIDDESGVDYKVLLRRDREQRRRNA